MVEDENVQQALLFSAPFLARASTMQSLSNSESEEFILSMARSPVLR